jgi:hypothetical protein
MSASALLMRAAAAGVSVELRGERILVSAKERPDENLLKELRLRSRILSITFASPRGQTRIGRCCSTSAPALCSSTAV